MDGMPPGGFAMAVVVETVEWNGVVWRRYPNAKQRNHRVYFQGYLNGKYALLHRALWALHHADGDPLNNDIGNLECVTVARHRRIEGDRGSFSTPKALKHLDSIRDKAAAWHRTPEGRAWHSRNSKQAMAKRPLIDLKCQKCGEPFRSKHRIAMYCSALCRQRSRPPREKTHTRTCPFCERQYTTERPRQNYCSYSCSSRARVARQKAG
jgi:hypothetical protein